MRITIDPFDPESIKDAEKQLKQYSRTFQTKVRKFTRSLARVGVRVAKAGFKEATYDGTNDVVVSLVPAENGYSVVASGQTVGFIEFGTGIKYREWDATGMDYVPPAHGTYGKGLGGRLDENGEPKGWFYAHDQYTYGNPPAEAMLAARNAMIEQVMQIAREVWND